MRAIYLDRSVEVPVAVLAVLKAGGSYLPLHTRDPQPRLRHALTESRAALLLTRTDLPYQDLAPELPVVLMDEPVPVPVPVLRPPAPGHAGQLAYLMFTSGSTGRPKGVAVTHRDLLRLVDDRCWETGHHRRSAPAWPPPPDPARWSRSRRPAASRARRTPR